MRSVTTILVAMAVGLVIAAGVRWLFFGSKANDSRRDDAIRSSPPKAVGLLPRPPRQDEPWTPPRTRLPESIIEAARVLFEQGFADPRGCEYREIELPGEAESYRNGDPPTPATHAWVIPAGDSDSPRYAVAWNGLVYPLARLGPSADLEADVRALVNPPAAGTRSPVRPDPRSSSSSIHSAAFDNLMTASQLGVAPAKVVLLLRLGRADLADALWQAEMSQAPGAIKGGPEVGRTWYALLTSAWVWALLDRAARAHSRGDDPFALASFRDLARIKPRIDDKIGDPRFFTGDRRQRGLPIMLDLRFLARLPEFVADQERRTREPRRTPALEARFENRAARIAALILDLDQISGAPHMLPGSHNLSDDPVVQAIVREGDDAVGPLLECLERDTRLTRNVDRDDRHPSRNLYIQGVDEAAFAALCSILGTRNFGPAVDEYRAASGRKARTAAAAEIRAYWHRTRGLDPLERAFGTLADDAAPHDQWLNAAETIARRNKVRGPDGSYPILHRSDAKVAPLWGEPLRGRVDPSVTELLARRTREIDLPSRSTNPIFDFHKANRLAELLAAWDLSHAPPTLKDRVTRCAAMLILQAPKNPHLQRLVLEIARFTELRKSGGDATALDDYAAWVRTVRPFSDGFFAPEMFEPLWRYPEYPAIAAAAAALFGDPGSPWMRLFQPGERAWGASDSLSELVASPLLGVALFRKLVLAGLADDRPSGSLRCDADCKVTIVIDKASSMFPTFHADDPHRPRPGSSMTLRMRDNFAWKLQQVEGFPRFELYWPRELRDRTIAAVVATLSRFGERLRVRESNQALHQTLSLHPKYIRGIFLFAPLDRPATVEDVAAGSAIFAAESGTDVRQWPLPATPLEARWTALEIRPDDPGLQGIVNPQGKPIAQISHLQGGLVWQAEEIREDDRWRRYYGFVGRQVIARVPAEEMDFPSPSNTGWYVIARDLDGGLVPPGVHDEGSTIVSSPVTPGAPLPIVVALRNHRGVSATIPADLVRTTGGLALRAGVSIRVFREPERKNVSAVGPQRRIEDPPPWPEVAPRKEPACYRSDAAKTLEPTEMAEVLSLDLRDLFELTRPGRYRVEVAFDDIRTVEGQPGRVSAIFTVAPAEGLAE